MAGDTIQSEASFLISLALNQFNEQYNRAIPVEGCSVSSITPDFGTELGYEITTDITTDFLRFRIYLTMNHRDFLGDFRLETDTSYHCASLGDEIYVAQGTVSRQYVDNAIYRFRWRAKPVPVGVFLKSMAGEVMTFLSGDPIEPVSP